MVEEDLPLEGKERIWYAVPIFVALFIGFAWLQNPALVFQAQESAEHLTDSVTRLGINTSATPTGMFYLSERENPDVIRFRKEDIEFMNRIYKETTFEQAYCGVIENGNEVDIWKANTINSSKTNLFFTTDNCPDAWQTGKQMMIHTQPSTNTLSETDKETFRDSEFDFTCTQAGIMPTGSNQIIGAVECFEKAGKQNSEIEVNEVEVRVEK